MVTCSSCQPSLHTLSTWGGRRPKGFWKGAQRGHLIRSWAQIGWALRKRTGVHIRTAFGWHLDSQKWPSVPGVTQPGLPFPPDTTWAAHTLFSGQKWQRQRPGAKLASFLPLGKNIHPRETPNRLFRNLPTLRHTWRHLTSQWRRQSYVLCVLSALTQLWLPCCCS